MTLPSIRTWVSDSQGNTSGATLTFVNPSGAVVGDLLVCMLVRRNNTSFSAQTYTFPAGWVQCPNAYMNGNGSNRMSFDVWSKVCTSGDIGASFNITCTQTGTGQNVAALVMAIENVQLTAGTYITASGASNRGSSAGWSSPSFSPAWGAVDQLYIAYCIGEQASQTISGASNGFSLVSSEVGVAGSSTGTRLYVDKKQSSASSDGGDSGTYAGIWAASSLSILGAVSASHPRAQAIIIS